MLIGIVGKIGSGKDIVVKTWGLLDHWWNQYGKNLIENENYTDVQFVEHALNNMFSETMYSTSWVNKKFATKIKEMCSILFDCNVKNFENIDFKNSLLPDIWQRKMDGKEDLTYRNALQHIGEMFTTHWNPDTWVIHTLNAYKPVYDDYPKGNYTNICIICDDMVHGCAKLCRICEKCWKKCSYPNWIISDVRLLNEINAIKKLGGYLIKIERGGKTTCTHSTEIEMDEYTDWDWVINNNGNYEQLINQVKNIMIELNVITM